MQYIYRCATIFLHVNQRWLPFLVGSSVGCQLNCPLYPYLKVVGCPLSCTLSCPQYPYMEVVGSLICMAKFPWAAHGQPMGSPLHCPLSCPIFSHLEVVDCPLSCPLFPYMEVVGSLICMAKFPRAAHGQPTPLPTELPTVSIYGSSGKPYLHVKIPMGSP